MNPVDFPLPFPDSYWVIPGRLLAGPYPGHRQAALAAQRLQTLLDCGIRQVISLVETGEDSGQGDAYSPYSAALHALAISQGDAVAVIRFPIRDYSIPDRPTMRAILDEIDQALGSGKPVYLHCWGGRGRTGTVIGCYLRRHALAAEAGVLGTLDRLRQHIQPFKESPETESQRDFVLSWQKGE